VGGFGLDFPFKTTAHPCKSPEEGAKRVCELSFKREGMKRHLIETKKGK
jgi:hypothetical protein